MIRVRIAQDWSAFGINVAVVMTDGDSERPAMIMRVTGNGESVAHWHWEPLPDGPVAVEPTFRFGDDEARALLDALLRHYQGASDMHTVRADLLHERARVDKLTDAVIRIAGAVR